MEQKKIQFSITKSGVGKPKRISIYIHGILHPLKLTSKTKAHANRGTNIAGEGGGLGARRAITVFTQKLSVS